jgi:hypothetical protein
MQNSDKRNIVLTGFMKTDMTKTPRIPGNENFPKMALA